MCRQITFLYIGGGFNSQRANVLKPPLGGLGVGAGSQIEDLSYTLALESGLHYR